MSTENASTTSPAAPTPVREDGVGRDVLEFRAGVLERSVQALPGITPETLQAQRPGGVANRDTSAMGWLSYLCWLSATRGTGAPTRALHVTDSARWSPQAVDDLRKAFAAEPIHLTLESGRQVSVHPKGSVAAARIVRNQLVTEWVQAQRVALLAQQPTTPEIVAQIDLANRAESRLRAEWLWCITHPGPKLPWAITGPDALPVSDPEPPVEYHDALTTADELLLQRAFVETNYLRIATLSERVRQQVGSKDSESAPLAHFMGVIAAEYGVQPEVMASEWSIGAAFASALARAESTNRAMKREEHERANQSPTPR